MQNKRLKNFLHCDDNSRFTLLRALIYMYSNVNYIYHVVYYIPSAYLITGSLYLLTAFVTIQRFYVISSVQCSSQLCPTVCSPMDSSTPGLPVCHQLPEFTQTHVH